MPRTVSGAYLAIINGQHVNCHFRVQAERGDGTWQELTNFLGMDWLEELHWGENIDQRVGSGTVVIGAEHIGADGVAVSLAPGMQASPANILASVYSPLLAESRGIRWQGAVTAPDVAPVAGDWIPLFDGKIDDVDDKGTDGTITLSVRDKGAWLLDTAIATKRMYGSATGIALETVMRSILADNLQPKLGGVAPTLYVWGAIAWNVLDFQQDSNTNVLEALQVLADQIGADVRYRWQPDGVTFGLTLMVPDRAKVAADWTLGPDDYFAVPGYKSSDIGVRNTARVRFTDATTGLPDFRDGTNGTSIAKHGARYMEVGEEATSQIDTGAEAQVMADAIVSDLAEPKADGEIETMFYPIVQLNDLGLFLANGRQYDTDQKLAVVQYKHDVTRETQRTTIQHRGNVAGAYWRWIGKGGGDGSGSVLPSFAETATTDESGGVTNAHLRIDVNDPEGRLTQFQFATGRTLGTLGAWSTVAPGPPQPYYAATVTLYEGDTGFIAYRAIGRDLSGNQSVLAQRAVAVGDARTPHVDYVDATFPNDTTTRLLARGDPLCAAWRMSVRTDRAPTAAELRAATLVAGQNVSADFALAVTAGQTLYVGAFAYGHADGTGIESAQFASVVVRDGSGAGAQPSASIELVSQDAAAAVVNLVGAIGHSALGPLQYRTRFSSATAQGAWTGWTNTGATSFSVQTTYGKAKFFHKTLELEVKQNDGQTFRAETTFGGELPGINTTEGLSERQQPYSTSSGGGYGGYATDTTGYTAGGLNRDSRLQALNRTFAKDVDTADNVPNGASSRVLPYTVIRASDNALMSRVGAAATIGDQYADTVARRIGGYFGDQFDAAPGLESGWANVGSVALVNAAGATMGKNIARFTDFNAFNLNRKLPFNPNKLYRMRARIRTNAANTAGASLWYVGLYQFDATGTSIANPNSGVAYVCASGAGPAVGVWAEFVGWYKGATLALSTYASTPSTDPRAPAALNVGCTQIAPLIYAGYNGTGGTFDVDYFLIDEYDEDAANRIYGVATVGANLYRARAFDDGSYAVQAGNSAGTLLVAGAVDSASRPVNDAFFRSSHTADNVTDGATRRTIGTTESHQNLAPAAMASNSVYTGQSFTVSLLALGLLVGDVISIGGRVQNAVASDSGSTYFYVQALTAGGGYITEFNTNGQDQQTTTAEVPVASSNFTIPATTAQLGFGLYSARAGGGYGRRFMVNRGPQAIPFTDAPLRVNRDTVDVVLDGSASPLAGGRRAFPAISASANVYRARPFDDGVYAVRSATSGGTDVASGVTDAYTGQLINTTFFRNAHTADNVANGATSRVLPYAVVRASDNALMSRIDNTAQFADVTVEAAKAGAMGKFFSEKFNVLPSGWTVSTGGTLSLQSGGQLSGKYVLQSVGMDWRNWAQASALPFNSSKLYRIRARVRQTVDPVSGTNNLCYVGLRCLDSAGTYLGEVYCCLAGQALTVAGGWIERTGWVKGATGFVSHVSTDPRAPVSLYANTASVQPLFILNYSNGTGTQQIDYIDIDELDEDAATRIYTVANSTANLYRARVLDDGYTATVSTNAAGTALHTGVYEQVNGQQVVNAFYRPYHTADTIADGGTKRAVLFTHLDGAGTLLTKVGTSATIADTPSQVVTAGVQGAVFREAFDVLPTTWGTDYGVGTRSLVSGLSGVTGKNVLQIANTASIRFPQPIPFNPALLYRARWRVRQTVDPTVGDARVYFALAIYDTTGTYQGVPYYWNVISDTLITVAGGWRVYEGWFKGLDIGGQGGGPATDPRTPARMPAPTWVTGAFTPFVIVNYPGGNGTAQLDYIEVVAFDEDASARTYYTVASNQTLYRGRSFDDGAFAVSASTSDGRSIIGTNYDSVRSLYVKDTYSRPTDTADSITNGASARVLPFSVIDSGNALLTQVAPGAKVGDQYADAVARARGAFFADTFETYPSATSGWNAGTNWSTVTGVGTVHGRYAARATGYGASNFNRDLPFNANKLYRARVRVRTTVANTTGTTGWYLGFIAKLADGTAANPNSGASYILAANASPPVNVWTEYVAWFKGASVPNSGYPTGSADPANPLPLNLGVVTIAPYILAGYSGAGGTFDLDYFLVDEFDEDGSYRTYAALRPDGNTNPIKQYDGANTKSFARGGVNGHVSNGQTIVFNSGDAFVSAPAVILTGGGALTRTGSVWRVNDTGATSNAGAGDTYDDTHALNVTRLQFTCRARLRQKATTTAAQANFGAGNAATSVGGTVVSAALASGVASNDTYTINFNVSHVVSYTRPSGGGTSTLVLAIDADPTGSGTWTERATVDYADTGDPNGPYTYTYTNEAIALTVSGFTASGQFRIRVKSQTNTQYTSATFSIHGQVSGTDASAGVTYATSVGDLYASRTPAADDFLDYSCVELAY